MVTSYLGEIKMFAGTYAPVGWRFCDGSALPISGNEVLFGLLGTQYGGDGKTTFCIPDLRSRVAIGKGQLNQIKYTTGMFGGNATVALLSANMPIHNHNLLAYNDNATTGDPSGTHMLAKSVPQGTGYSDVKLYSSVPSGGTPDSPLDPIAITPVGSGLAHNNLMPCLTINFIISINGLYPVSK
ncbi:MAG: Tail Collar domain protein [Bacteroidetes bacterium]|nr:Tail Collar domain protein [Bacteroidota bacterium]